MVISLVTVDAIFCFIGLQQSRIGDSSRDRTSLEDLLHHGFLSSDSAVVLHTINLVFVRNKTRLSGFTIPANLHWGAILAIGPSTSSVDRAGPISHFILLHPLVSITVVSSIAAIVVACILEAREQRLR